MAYIIDLEDVLERLQNDYGLLFELIADFQKDYTKKRKLIEKALKEKKFDQVKYLAHSLKGEAGNLSIASIQSCFMLIESHLTETGDTALIKDVLNEIDEQFKEL